MILVYAVHIIKSQVENVFFLVQLDCNRCKRVYGIVMFVQVNDCGRVAINIIGKYQFNDIDLTCRVKELPATPESGRSTCVTSRSPLPSHFIYLPTFLADCYTAAFICILSSAEYTDLSI